MYAAWQAPQVAQKFAPVERRLARSNIRRVLDVGCGPGTNAGRFAGADYVGVDINEHYLSIARTKHKGRFVQADLETADLAGLGMFDTILVNSFLHHIPDDAVDRVLGQLRRLLTPTGALHSIEVVIPDRRSIATLMARLDRGRYARRLKAWRALFEPHFEPLAFEPFKVIGGLWVMVYMQGGAR